MLEQKMWAYTISDGRIIAIGNTEEQALEETEKALPPIQTMEVLGSMGGQTVKVTVVEGWDESPDMKAELHRLRTVATLAGQVFEMLPESTNTRRLKAALEEAGYF